MISGVYRNIMAIQTDSKAAQINVTPLIDVLLVLLIIFLVVTPTKPVGLKALLPQESTGASAPSESTVVLQVTEGDAYRLNQEVIAKDDLSRRLREVFAIRAQKVLFVKAEAGMEFVRVARAIDIAKSSGVDQIGLLLGDAVTIER